MEADIMKRKGLRFYLRIYRKILAQDLKSKMSYRADFIISTLGMIFTNISGFVGFWIQNSFYVLDLAFRFKDYAKYPITIFSSVFRFIFTFIVPIAFIAYYPSLVILRPDEVPMLSWLSPIIGVAFFFVSYKIWMHGAMKYNGTGS